MIIFVTGLPGHGKTLFTLAEIHKEHAGKRPIWYVSKEAVDSPGAGIAGLNLDDWEPFDDPLKWWDCPDGAVIVIDECQYCFPRRGNAKGKEPDYISAFAEHRKKGFDIYLITQDAKNVDHFVRRLANKHVHYWRPFGASRSTRWEFPRLVDPFDKFQQKEATSKTLVKQPRDFFSAYASANVHTVKPSIPKKLFLLPLAVLVVIGGGVMAYGTLHKASDKPVESGPKSSEPVQSAKPAAASESRSEPKKDKPLPNGRISGVAEFGAGQGIALLEIGNRVRRIPLVGCVYITDHWECTYQGATYVQESAAKPASAEQAERGAWLGG